MWDVAVVGAGPAGAAALESARHGQAVVLIDKAVFPRSKVCGSCLNGHALAVLQQVGLSDLPERLGGVPLQRFCLGGAGRRAVVALPTGVAVSRAAFDAALVQAAIDAGADLVADTSRLERVLGRCPGSCSCTNRTSPRKSMPAS